MGKLIKGSSQETTQSSSSEPWKPAQDSLKNIISEYDNWYNNAQDTGYISPTGDLSSTYADYLSGLGNASTASQTGTNNLLTQANSSGTSALNGYTNVANGGLNYSTSDIANNAKALYNNDLVDSQISAANRQIDNTLNENTLTGIDRNATSTGNMGSSRAGIAQAVASREAAQMKTDNANTITSNAYNNALSTAANTLQNNNNTTLSGISGNASLSNNLAGQASQYGTTTTNALSPLLQSSQLNQMLTANTQADQIGSRDYTANLLSQYYTPALTSIAGLGGTSTGTQKSPGTSMMSSILGGAQMAGSAYSNFSGASDKRLKKNIQYIGTEDGHKLYTWDWTDKAKKIVGSQPSFGVIAQEVKEYMPKAVHRAADGYYRVDYGMLFGDKGQMFGGNDG